MRYCTRLPMVETRAERIPRTSRNLDPSMHVCPFQCHVVTMRVISQGSPRHMPSPPCVGKGPPTPVGFPILSSHFEGLSTVGGMGDSAAMAH